MNEYIVKHAKDADADHIFDCGQCFRWERQADGSYTGTAFGKIANIKIEDDQQGGVNIIIRGATEEDYNNIWKDYLDMDRDYGAIKAKLTADDEIMKNAVEAGSGIRILNQDLWETIVSFIISQNNNIPRIKKCIENLAKGYGRCIGEFDGRKYYDLPTPEELAALTVEDLSPVRLGYRAKYLIGTAKMVCDKGLPETADELSALPGVGPKVASCIMLFGMAKHDSFPVDVWVARVMNRLYGLDEKNRKAIGVFAEEHFGELAGFAQQYLFYYIRD